MKKILAACFLLSVLLVLGLACDSASPVAPSGTLLTVSASPTEISTNGTATIRATALRANGTPVNPGTVIRFDTSLGTIDEQAETDDDGVARVTLTGDGRIGTATVTARSGVAESATVDVKVGKVATSVSLQATPSSIPEIGGTVQLLASVRDSEGQPLSGVTANFNTQIGRLASAGGFLTTGTDGQVSDTLTVEEDDVNALAASANDFEVRVEVGGEGAVVTDTFNVRLESVILVADFTFVANGLSVQFTDLSTVNGNPAGGGELNWLWSFGDGATSRDQNPSHQYGSGGTFSVTLKVSQGRSEDQASRQVTVTQ